MQDEDKTKDQLLAELKALRSLLHGMERSETGSDLAVDELSPAEQADSLSDYSPSGPLGPVPKEPSHLQGLLGLMV